MFCNLVNTYNYIVHVNFNRDSRKIKFAYLEYYSSYNFCDNCLKLGSYVLGTKRVREKFIRGQNFSLGLRSENTEV